VRALFESRTASRIAQIRFMTYRRSYDRSRRRTIGGVLRQNPFACSEAIKTTTCLVSSMKRIQGPFPPKPDEKDRCMAVSPIRTSFASDILGCLCHTQAREAGQYRAS
jgi:hypothetical protein